MKFKNLFKPNVSYPTIIAGLGRCGTTILYRSLVPRRGMLRRFEGPDQIVTGVYKTHDRPPESFNKTVKVVFLFGSPFEIVISSHRMINEWGINHSYNLCSSRFKMNNSLFPEDTLELEKSFDLWYKKQSFPFMALRYETMWDSGILEELSDYLEIKVKLPEYRERKSLIKNHPYEMTIRETYKSLALKIDKARDVNYFYPIKNL